MTMRPKSYRPYTTPKVFRKRDTRAPAWQRGYDEKWYKLRQWHISQHPLCVVPGCGRGADEVDHIIPFKGLADPLRLDAGNLQSLCHSHHVLKTWDERKGKK